MIKKIKWIAIFAIATMMVIAGCNNIANEATVSGRNLDSKGTIGVFVGSVSRSTIAPLTLEKDGDEIDHYAITGESKGGLTLAETSLTVNDIVNGTAVIEDVPLDDWTLTLYAVNSSNQKILSGTSYCNMKSSGASTVTFNLSSYGLSATGSYNITIQYNGSAWKDSLYSFTWGLYDVNTGESLTSLGVYTNGTSYTTVASESANAIHATPNYYTTGEITGVTPGNYVFMVKIYNGSTLLGLASEQIQIEPGRATTGTLELNDNIIKTAPTAPTGLTAQRIVDSQGTGDFYNVRLYWTDTSNNEESFELILKEFSTTAEAWGAYEADCNIANSAPVYVYDYEQILTLTNTTDRVRYIDGSLFSGSQELILSFPTGTMWDVQIRAVNNIGKSASCIRVANATNNTALTYEVATAPTPTITLHEDWATSGYYVIGYGIGETDKWVHISLVKILYALDGGTLTLDSTAYLGTTYVEYKPYTLRTDGSTDDTKYIPLLVIDGTTNTLVRNSIDYTKWILATNANVTNPAAVTYNTATYQNFSVIAVYGATSGNITITSVTIQALASASFTDTLVAAYVSDTASDPGTSNSCKNGTISIPRGTAEKYVTVSVTTGTAETKIFSYYRLYVDGTFIEQKDWATSSINFTNFSTTRLNEGSATNIRVDAFTEGGESASSSFTIQKVN